MANWRLTEQRFRTYRDRREPVSLSRGILRMWPEAEDDPGAKANEELGVASEELMDLGVDCD